MTRPIYILNGPNLNMLGKREPEIYGTTTLSEVEEQCRQKAQGLGYEIVFRQSNAEYDLVDWIQEAMSDCEGMIINPAAFTHTSVAILDALKLLSQPIIELHISNPHKREAFRHHSYVTMAATGLICGLGIKGYKVSVEAMAGMLERG